MSPLSLSGHAGRAAAVLALLAAASLARAAGPVWHPYVVMNGAGPMARVVIEEPRATCPALTLDGSAPQPMTPRPVPASAAPVFPVTVCELQLPLGAAGASLGGQALPLPPAQLGTIVGLGDTGCRLKAGKPPKAGKASTDGAAAGGHDADEAAPGKYQDCDVPAQWPFARIAAQAAASRPDLVLHVGDYVYREAACPASQPGCAGSPHGDNWTTWKADFFDPARPLLAAAPWIAVRGNHEICSRNGLGYALFLDPRPAAQQAPRCDAANPADQVLPGYAVSVGGRGFVVIDTSNADDLCAGKKDPSKPVACNAAAYAHVFDGLEIAPGAWLVTHKPLWALRKKDLPVTQSLQQALRQGPGLPRNVALALAGHIHFWQVLSLADGRAPQLVLGNGGTMLAGKEKKVTAKAIDGTTVAYGKTHDGFGYTVFRPHASHVEVVLRQPGAQGASDLFGCEVRGPRVSCARSGSD